MWATGIHVVVEVMAEVAGKCYGKWPFNNASLESIWKYRLIKMLNVGGAAWLCYRKYHHASEQLKKCLPNVFRLGQYYAEISWQPQAPIDQ